MDIIQELDLGLKTVAGRAEPGFSLEKAYSDGRELGEEPPPLGLDNMCGRSYSAPSIVPSRDISDAVLDISLRERLGVSCANLSSGYTDSFPSEKWGPGAVGAERSETGRSKRSSVPPKASLSVAKSECVVKSRSVPNLAR